jgi:hypothetical protein
MRPIGYVAAAAAGLIAPIAFALPAMAGTQSPILSGVSSIVGDVDGEDGPDNGPDNGDNHDDNGDNHDDNGDNHDDNGDNHDDNGDNGDRYDDNDGRWDDSDPDVKAYSSGSEASGNIAIIMDAFDLDPLDSFVLSSPALNAGCSANNISGAVVRSDRFGHAVASGRAINCIPGTYKIAISQTGGGEETYYGDLTVD